MMTARSEGEGRLGGTGCSRPLRSRSAKDTTTRPSFCFTDETHPPPGCCSSITTTRLSFRSFPHSFRILSCCRRSQITVVTSV